MTESATMAADDSQSAPPVLSYSLGHKSFSACLKSSFETNRFEELEAKSLELATCDKDNKKLILDLCFREYLTSEGVELESDLTTARTFVQFAIRAAKKELCNPTTPIQVLADIFDMATLAACESLFKIIEDEVATWRSKEFYTPIRNSLLRICNDLLRRLSRTQNTVFCGRILLFLAKFFPFSERSGLNVISEFNLDNITAFSKVPITKKDEIAAEADTKEVESNEKDGSKAEKADENGKADPDESEGKKEESESMEIELVVEEEVKLDVEKKEEEGKETESVKKERVHREFKLYSKFWALQNFFRYPALCYQKDQWETFCGQVTDIMAWFTKHKLDHHKAKEENEDRREGESQVFDQYFAKYLTNQNLLSLQLNDSNFRRYVYIQILIVFQYFQTMVKSKTEAQVLTTDQTKWIDEQRKKIFKLIEETPPNGNSFLKNVKAILKRELIWNLWKNEGCPSFVIKPKAEEEQDSAVPRASGKRKRKIPLGDQMRREAEMGKINLGNKGLTKLWNLNPDNLEACKDADRNFLPSLESYFEDAIMEIDPVNKVEDEYKRVNNGEWGWRALRLMSRRSQHFFLVGNSQISKLPEYLEMMMGKMANDFGKPIGSADMETDGEDGNQAEKGENGESNTDAGSIKLTDEQVSSLAVALADHWKALVPKLGLPAEKVDSCRGAGRTNQDICLHLLKEFVAQEGEGATPDEIRYMVEGLKIGDLIEGVL